MGDAVIEHLTWFANGYWTGLMHGLFIGVVLITVLLFHRY